MKHFTALMYVIIERAKKGTKKGSDENEARLQRDRV